VIVTVAVLLTLAAVGAILHPLLTGTAAPLEATDEELTDVQHRKRMALLALRDVEYDFHAGKLDEDDYRALKAQVSAEALAALDEEAREVAVAGGGGRGAAAVEAEIAALRASIRQGVICTQCGHPNPRGSRFCAECGAAVAAEGSAGSGPTVPAGRAGAGSAT
jgi:cytochrome c-type biogenesis protein CcmI